MKRILVIGIIMLILVTAFLFYKNYTKQQSDINRSLDCLELVKNTPDRGNGEYIGVNIVKYWEWIAPRYEQIVLNTECTRSDDMEDCNAEKQFTKELYEESKPLYENYIAKCDKI